MSSTPQMSYLVAVQHLGIQAVEALCTPLYEHSKSNQEMLVDLSLVETYDPIGVQLLYSCQKTSAEAGQPFAVVNAAPTLGHVMESLGLRPETLRGISPEARADTGKSVSIRGEECPPA
jgi:anti-anti-sigma regulatory factor